jgi:hypothetical protein
MDGSTVAIKGKRSAHAALYLAKQCSSPVRATNSISEFAAQMSVQKTFDIKAWPPSFFIGRSLSGDPHIRHFCETVSKSSSRNQKNQTNQMLRIRPKQSDFCLRILCQRHFNVLRAPYQAGASARCGVISTYS